MTGACSFMAYLEIHADISHQTLSADSDSQTGVLNYDK